MLKNRHGYVPRPPEKPMGLHWGVPLVVGHSPPVSMQRQYYKLMHLMQEYARLGRAKVSKKSTIAHTHTHARTYTFSTEFLGPS